LNLDNVVLWIKDTIKACKLRDEDFNQFTSDGASKAIGSVAEFESQTRTTRSNDIDLQICVSHQNERAAGFASGTHDFAEPVNAKLGELLKKSHGIQSRLSRAPTRMMIYRQVQERKQRKPMLNPKPANETRWNARNIETARALEIMDDVQETNKRLLATDEIDYDSLTAEEKRSGNLDRFIYTNDDIMTLRQWEASSNGAKYFSKFTQENGNTISYMLLEVQIARDLCRNDWFEMVAR
jgi:hypothetical protein